MKKLVLKIYLILVVARGGLEFLLIHYGEWDEPEVAGLHQWLHPTTKFPYPPITDLVEDPVVLGKPNLTLGRHGVTLLRGNQTGLGGGVVSSIPPSFLGSFGMERSMPWGSD